MGVRLRAEECLDYEESITLEITDEKRLHSLRIREGVAIYTEGEAPGAINTVRLDSADFYDIFLGKRSWEEAIEEQRVELSGDADAFYAFINLFDW